MFACAWKEGGLRYHQADDNSLEIRNVTRKNAGIYTVKCTNEEGENQTTIKLDVQCKKHKHMWFSSICSRIYEYIFHFQANYENDCRKSDRLYLKNHFSGEAHWCR